MHHLRDVIAVADHGSLHKLNATDPPVRLGRLSPL